MKKTMIIVSMILMTGTISAEITPKDSTEIHDAIMKLTEISGEIVKNNNPNSALLGTLIPIVTLIIGLGVGRLIHYFAHKEAKK